MAAQEYRRTLNQGHGMLVPETDRLFAEAMRRLLLKVVAMIEDRYQIRPVNSERQPVHQK